MKTLWKKCLAGLLTAALCLPLSAGALTADQLKEVLEEYYLNDIPQEAMEAETVEEVLAALGDPYTTYMDEEAFAAFLESMEDSSVVGIGVSGVADEAGLLLVNVYADSPAAALGLVPGDIIIRVEGHDAAECDATLISGWLRGEAGTSVAFTVRHADGREESYTTTRAEVVIPTTAAELLADGTTGYFSCTTFGSETQSHFVEGTTTYDDASLWIVDMRSNGGGDVYAATQSLGTFLGTGTMLYLRNGSDTLYRYTSAQEQTTLSPVITLVSGQTASSAEIFALEVKDRHGGMVIGSSTYGKGVAQIILTGEQKPEVLTENDALRVTAYQYYGTSLSTANSIGVLPDLLVDPNDADEIARLFSSVMPENTLGWARLHLGSWRWYLDLERASSEENAPYLTELLEAVPPGCKVFLGDGDGWRPSAAAELAAVTGRTDYTPRSFSDVAGLDCEKAANTLRTFGILNGYRDGSFRPDQTLTRAELCALLVQAMHLKPARAITDYPDVRSGAWYYDAVQSVTAAGYMVGTGKGRFSPESTVTEETLITVMGRLAAALNLNFYQSSKAVPEEPGVPAAFSSWAAPWVWLLSASQKNYLGQPINLLPAAPADIPPRSAVSRGNTALTLYNILYAADIIPY